MANANGLTIERLALNTLRLDPNNPRLHGPRQVAQIARSIETFGFNVPVLVDNSNKVLAGHGRVLACQKLGVTEVPVVRLAHLSEAQARAFAIADNRLTENAVWNERLLGEVFRNLAALDLDFSLEVTGFSMAEIDLYIEGLSEVGEPGPDPDDQLPGHPGGPAVTVAGDVWRLGRHRLCCGSALESASYEALMGDASARMAFTDPPYNVPINGHVCGLGAIRHGEFAMATGEMSSDEFTGFLSAAFRLMARHSSEGSLHYVCMDWRHQIEVLAASKEAFSELKNLCVWVKENAGMGSLYRSRHEFVFLFKRGKAAHRNNVELGRYGRNRTNVWEYPSPSAFGRRGDEGRLLALHPTVKPVALIADAILDASARGDVVLDPFIGSGSTLIAAERVGRRCYGIELETLYVDTAIRRWQQHTGDTAVHAVTGERFDDRLAEGGACDD